MQISRQSADSQQASMMPQSMSQGRSQSAHSPELQQQQQMQESSEVQEPQVAQSSTMLQRVRNSQKRQERMQWTQQSAGEQGREVLTPQDGLGQPLASPQRMEILPWELRDGKGPGAQHRSGDLPQCLGTSSAAWDMPRPQKRPILGDMK